MPCMCTECGVSEARFSEAVETLASHGKDGHVVEPRVYLDAYRDKARYTDRHGDGSERESAT